MATKRTPKLRYQWANQTWHSRKQLQRPAAPAAPRKKNYVVTPTGAIGTGTAAAMQRLANQTRVGPPKPAGASARPGFAPPVPGPFAPPDPIYDTQVGRLRQQRTGTMADLDTGRQQGLAGYGYTENAATGALAFDPNNPFSKAALLKRDYDQSRRRTGGTMAAGGQLYAGAYQSAQDVVNRGELQSQDTLQKSLADFLARNTRAGTSARTDYESDVEDAEAARLQRIDTNPLYEPTNARTPLPGAKPKAKPKPRAAPRGKAAPRVKAAPKARTPKRAPKGKPYQWANKTWHTRRQRKPRKR